VGHSCGARRVLTTHRGVDGGRARDELQPRARLHVARQPLDEQHRRLLLRLSAVGAIVRHRAAPAAAPAPAARRAPAGTRAATARAARAAAPTLDGQDLARVPSDGRGGGVGGRQQRVDLVEHHRLEPLQARARAAAAEQVEQPLRRTDGDLHLRTVRRARVR